MFFVKKNILISKWSILVKVKNQYPFVSNIQKPFQFNVQNANLVITLTAINVLESPFPIVLISYLKNLNVSVVTKIMP